MVVGSLLAIVCIMCMGPGYGGERGSSVGVGGVVNWKWVSVLGSWVEASRVRGGDGWVGKIQVP